MSPPNDIDDTKRIIIISVVLQTIVIIIVAAIAQIENDPLCQPNIAIDQGLHHTELVCTNYTASYLVQVEDDPYCQIY